MRLALPLILLLALLQPALPAAPFVDRVRLDPVWNDGRAEYAVFRAEERRYGLLRETEVRHILVREHFSGHEPVKAADWRAPGTYPVFKLQQMITVPTGAYRYDQGHTAYWRVGDGRLFKFAHVTNDSCGLTYKLGLRDGEQRWRYRAFTYWEGMSEVDTTWTPPAGALFYEELPFVLRQIAWGRTTLFEAPLAPSIIGSRADEPAWRPAAFAVERVPSGWRVTVKHAQGTDRLTFDAQSPHALNYWERWDGGRLTRTQLVRMPYWELNQPGDERYLQPGATYP